MTENFIHPSAVIGVETLVGRYSVVSEDVILGERCIIGNYVVIHPGTVIGNGVRIDDGAVIGKRPLKAQRSAITKDLELPPAKIRDHCLIGAHAVLYAGSELGEGVLVADSAQVRERVTIGEYTIVGRGVTIENHVRIGRKCKLETGGYITAYSVLEDFCFIAPLVTTTNDNYLGRTEERFKHFKGVTVRRGGRIGAGAVILPGIEIGEDAVVGAGAVVTRNVPPRKIVVGVPAEIFRDVPEEQWLEKQGWE